MAPLKDLLVLDFSTLLPGPLASLFLADAGAEVIKIERPDTGDAMRGYTPAVDGQSLNFTMLNRGKKSISIDLKDPQGREKLRPLIEKADIIIEQFRPGVMDRLGLGYKDVVEVNPCIIYCSISGWGASGPKAHEPGHDLNYIAETGILGLSVGGDGAPVLPPILAADIAGGSYPALVNILLALRQRDRTGEGVWLDIAMGQNLFPFAYWALGTANALGQWPIPGGELVTGGSPRYQIYRTADGRYIAAAPLEDKFWENFTALIGLPEEFRDDSKDPARVRAEVAKRIAAHDSQYWQELFRGKDLCCSLVMSMEEALANPHWAARRAFDSSVDVAGRSVPALPSIISDALRDRSVAGRSPKLGEDNPHYL